MPILNHSKPGSPAAVIVLQWLCYSLWSWTLIALSWFLSATLAYFFVDSTGQHEYMIYLLAALVVLLPISFGFDKLYAKYEPAQKHGFAAVVLVLNAVVVFLAALGAVIAAMVSAMLLVFRPEGSTAATIAILSSLVSATLATLLFLRILNHQRLSAFNKIFPSIVIGITLFSLLAGIAGPVRHEFNARNDRIIENHLPSLVSEIQQQTSRNGMLPANLDDLTFQSYNKDAEVLIKQNKVDYRVVAQPGETGQKGTFELCVTYQTKRGDGNLDYKKRSPSSSDNTYIGTDDHPAGRHCYNMQTY